jgi:hypothetical protein
MNELDYEVRLRLEGLQCAIKRFVPALSDLIRALEHLEVSIAVGEIGDHKPTRKQ